MILRECALSPQTGRNRGRQELGQFPQLPPGLCVVNTLSGIDDGSFSLHEDSCDLGNCPWIRSRARREGGGIVQRLGHFLGEDISRYLNEGRPRTAILNLRECTAHRIRDNGGEDHLFYPLGDVPIVDRRIKVWRDVGEVASIPSGQYQDGN